MAEMSVELVAVERPVWSGHATSLFAETTVGELGILPGHTPLLGELVEGGIVKITTTDNEVVTAAVFGGFLPEIGSACLPRPPNSPTRSTSRRPGTH